MKVCQTDLIQQKAQKAAAQNYGTQHSMIISASYPVFRFFIHFTFFKSIIMLIYVWNQPARYVWNSKVSHQMKLVKAQI